MDEGENPRESEKEQILRLMSLIADCLYVQHFDPQIGTARVENRIQKNEDIPEGHLAAYRMAREEILYGLLRFVDQIVQNYFITTGKAFQKEKLFQYRFPEPLWDSIENSLLKLRKLPLWVNRDLSATVFGGKQNYELWQTIFETGKTPQGPNIIPSGGINLMKMIQSQWG